MAYVRNSLPSQDSKELAPNLRESDKRELSALSARDYEHTLYLGALVSNPSRTIIHEGKVIGMYGVSPLFTINPKYGCVWCLASDKLSEIKMQFVRQSLSEIEDMAKGFTKLINFVHAENTESIEWLKFLGFSLSKDPILLGPKKEPFYYFER